MKKILVFLGLSFGIIAFAQSISYPVAELNNCQDREDCRQYCDNLAHTKDCLDFAESNNLFASAELEEARKVVNALEQGLETPGNCQSKTECHAYCSEGGNARECLNFGKEVGLLSQEEITEAEKIIPFLEKGETPGGCGCKAECEAYCSGDEHKEECIAFALKAGLMTEEEAELVEKTGGKGPGGCQSEEECNAYCNDPKNQEECFDFAKEHGLISEEEIEKIEKEEEKKEEGKEQIMEAVNSAPPEVSACLEEKLGSGVVESIKTGDFEPTPEMGEAVKQCFEEIKGPQQEPPEQGQEVPPGEAPSNKIRAFREYYLNN